MAKTDEKVMSLVEKELDKKPDASVDELYEKATKVDESIGELTKRQFNARYPLQVKRRRGGSRKKSGGRKTRKRTRATARKGGGKKARTTATAGGREAVRETFMRFASEMAAADDRKDLVRFLAGVDSYVDDVMKVTGK